MSVILILILFSLLVAVFFLFGFLWSVKTGQYADDISPAVRILSDDKPTESTSTTKPNQ